MSEMSGSLSSSSSGPEAEQLVDQHLLQRELLAAVEVDLELGEHLADDRAEFLGQLVLGERRRGLGIDALEQAREHLLLDPVDRGLEAFVASNCPARPTGAWRSASRAIASPRSTGTDGPPKLSSSAPSASGSIGGNWLPPSPGLIGAGPFIGWALPNCGRPPALPPFHRCVVRMRS